MNRIFIIPAIILLLSACNSQEQNHTEHNQKESTDHSAMEHWQPASASEMKQLMDGMMTKMHQQKATGNNDIDYANMMLQHHQGAVDMANLQLSKGKDDSLKVFSKKIIAAQQREIMFMGEFISRNQATSSANNNVFKKAMDVSMQSMMSADTKVYNDIDKDFVAQMIPHHQSAVDMAKAYLQYGTNEALRKMSEDIVKSQSEEISWLKTK